MTDNNNDPHRAKVHHIYAYIRDNYYLNRPDLRIKGEEFNAALLFSLLVGLFQGKALIIGEPGLGKTTSVEYMGALLYRLPLGTIWRGEISGHPEQTEEKIIGRPDLGKLSQGKEVVVWSHFSLLPVKIVDEINRLPETKQSLILDGVDRGNWAYLNDAIINREYCLFATANYQDQGTNTIIAPLMDRFDMMVESKHPGANLAGCIGTESPDGAALRHESLENQFKSVLSREDDYEDRMKKVEELSGEFGSYLEENHQLPSFSLVERQAIRSQKDEIRFDVDSHAFLRFITAELSFCYPYGQKRSRESCEEGCHFNGYLCHRIKSCISNRFPMSARSLSQALAWLLGDDHVDLEHLKAVLPYTLAHRIQWKENAVARCEKAMRRDPLEIYMAKEAVEEVHERYMEQGHRIKEALAVACRIAENEAMAPLHGDHPLYWEIRKDLGEEVHPP